jgi:hypothetical protein
MSIRLFHRGGRLVMRSSRASRQASTWRALHLRPVVWEDVFRPALALLGFTVENEDGALRFGTSPSTGLGTGPSTTAGMSTGSIRWTRGAFWTTIRVQLPACSAKKRDLLAAALLKAARYRSAVTDVQPVRARSA